MKTESFDHDMDLQTAQTFKQRAYRFKKPIWKGCISCDCSEPRAAHKMVEG